MQERCVGESFMRLAALFSGGKDSTLALHRAVELGYEVAVLVNLVAGRADSMLYHVPNARWTALQAEAMGIPIIQRQVENDEEAALLEVLKEAARVYGVEGIVTGAVRSTFQAARFQRAARRLGLWCFNPLWLMDQGRILRESLERGFQYVITAVAAYPLGEDLLGRHVDWDVAERLTGLGDLINPAGEGGEYETFVLYAPLFRRRIRIVEADLTYDRGTYTGVYLIKRAVLEDPHVA